MISDETKPPFHYNSHFK